MAFGLLAALGGGVLAKACAPVEEDAPETLTQALTTGTINYAETKVQLESMTPGTGSPFAVLLGFYSSGDGGGGLFAWVPGAATSDGGTVFAVGSGAWRRIYSGPVNVRWFGAKGDGVQDDTQSIRAAIAAADRPAMSSVSALDVGNPSMPWLGGAGGEVLIPRGVYVVSDTITILSTVKVYGEGPPTTQIKFAINNVTKVGFEIRRVPDSSAPGAPETRVVMGQLRDLELAATGRMKSLVTLLGCTGYELKNLRLWGNYAQANGGADYGVSVLPSPTVTRIALDIVLTNVHVLTCANTSLLISNANSVSCRGCYFTFSGNHGVDASGEAHLYEQCTFESCGNSAPVANPNPNVADKCGIVMRQGSVTMSACYFENNAGYDMFFGSENRCHVAVFNPTVAVSRVKTTRYRVVADADGGTHDEADPSVPPSAAANTVGVIRLRYHAGGTIVGGVIGGLPAHVIKADAPTGLGATVLGLLMLDNINTLGTSGSLDGYPGFVVTSPKSTADPAQSLVYGTPNFLGIRLGAPTTSAASDAVRREIHGVFNVTWNTTGLSFTAQGYPILPSGATMTGTVPVVGAVIADAVVAALTSNPIAGIETSALVTAADVVSLTVTNRTSLGYVNSSGSAVVNLWKR